MFVGDTILELDDQWPHIWLFTTGAKTFWAVSHLATSMRNQLSFCGALGTMLWGRIHLAEQIHTSGQSWQQSNTIDLSITQEEWGIHEVEMKLEAPAWNELCDYAIAGLTMPEGVCQSFKRLIGMPRLFPESCPIRGVTLDLASLQGLQRKQERVLTAVHGPSIHIAVTKSKHNNSSPEQVSTLLSPNLE